MAIAELTHAKCSLIEFSYLSAIHRSGLYRTQGGLLRCCCWRIAAMSLKSVYRLANRAAFRRKNEGSQGQS
jgi:hypothetical protein